ncbi:hypothetical protein POM88_045903 [Heracleum sosnowskyi]|uniref:Reverse transcriptase zinc-binding domain-containing protein n=1 Tax=Heracleum sosnowskyi TaxID=360622 RepID=A0AAD8M6G9_9APIA|nr:hypothetical protein POM88_045903 [Heracleum sosnowskyi]
MLNRELIQQCFLIPDSQLILTIPLGPFDHSDAWFWHYNKNGCYSVRSGYNLALRVDRASPSSSTKVLSAWWRSFWEIKIPHKILTFGWRGFQEILPTTKGLRRRNVAPHIDCPLCRFGEDSNAHAVFWCPFTQEVWALFEYSFLMGPKEDISFRGKILHKFRFFRIEGMELPIFDLEKFWGKSLLIAGLRRRTGNGQNTKAFKDPWIPRPPSFLLITKGVNDNMNVFELIQHPCMLNRELIQQCFLIPDSQLILTIPLGPFDHSDEWFWHYNKNGCYSVRSGYNLALRVDRASPSSSTKVLSAWWRDFWAIKIPHKILTFGWRGFQESLPTTKGLYRKNVAPRSGCPLCGFGEDSNAHATFWCPFAQEVWALFEYSFLMGPKEDISFRGVLFYATELLERDLFDISILGILKRNTLCFLFSVPIDHSQILLTNILAPSICCHGSSTTRLVIL